MSFDSSWMTDLHKLQKRAAELGNSDNPSGAALELAMDLLNKWGVGDLPFNSSFESLKSLWAKSDLYAGLNSNIDITERKQDILVSLSIPGIKEADDFSVRLANQVLYLTGISRDGKEAEKFNREVRLPAPVTAQGATAAYRNNRLTITLPKIAPQEGEKIAVSFVPSD